MRRKAAARGPRLLALVVLLWHGSVVAAPGANLRLPKNRDAFFVEDNLVYSRYLSLSHDGTYRQINQDSIATVEADRGTWEQDGRAVVSLHSTYRGLRFRALLSGPLTIVLDSVEKIAALPKLAEAIRRWLGFSQDTVFASASASDWSALPAVVSVDRQAEIYTRADLSDLLGQIEQTIRTEDTRSYSLTPLRLPGRPLLLVLRGAVFGPERAADVCREYRVPKTGVPPFYFAQVDAKEFTRRVGIWRELEPLGGPAAP